VPRSHSGSASASSPSSLDQPALLTALRARLARMEGAGRARHGLAAIPVCDGLPLPGGGLARAALHEVLAASPGCGVAFCALLLARTGGTVLWITAGGGGGLLAWPPGLARCGLTPERLVLARAEGWTDALWAMEEALRCPAVSGALLVLDRKSEAALDLTVTRRLQLAAEAGGALGLLLRPDAGQEDRQAAAHSAAITRWRISPLPSAAEEDHPRWRLELLRARGGTPGGPWAVSWRGAEGRLTLDAEEAAEGRLARR
jgi:protein ImuA